MALELDFWNNLVYVVFGNIYIFLGMVGLAFMWFGLQYDIPKWIGFLFLVTFGAWFSVVEGVWWLLALILISVAFFVSIQLMRRLRN